MERLRRLVLLGEIDHDDALQHADLAGGEADARRVMHRLDHVVHQLRGCASSTVATGRADEPQARVGQDENGTDGHDALRLGRVR